MIYENAKLQTHYFKQRKNMFFSKASALVLGPLSLLFNRHQGALYLGHEADPSPPPTGKVKNE